MSALSISVPYPVFSGQDGLPLDNGYVWIGTANLYPITNPIAVYFDEALTIQATQPLRTINGFISNAGTPARLYVNAAQYSIQVLDKNGSLVYSSQNGADGITASTISFIGFKGQVGDVSNLAGDDGADWIGFEPNNFGSGAVAMSVQDKLRESVSVTDYGASPSATAAVNTVAIQSALNNAAGKFRVYIPSGLYVVNATIRIPSNTYFYGDGESSIIKMVGTEGRNTTVVLTGSRDDKRENIVIESIQIDFNRDRWTVEGGTQLVDSLYGEFQDNDENALSICYSENVLISNVSCIDAYKHNFDVLAPKYVSNTSGTEYDPQPSRFVRIENCYAYGAGDDNFTTHFSSDIWVVDCRSENPSGVRVPSNSNCFEVDDGSRNVILSNVVGIGGATGIQIKGHDYAPAPYNVIVNGARIANCASGLDIRHFGFYSGNSPTARNVSVSDVMIVAPKAWTAFNGNVIAADYGVQITSYENVNLTNITINDGSEDLGGIYEAGTTLTEAVVRLYNGARNVLIQNLSIYGFDSATYGLWITSTFLGKATIDGFTYTANTTGIEYPVRFQDSGSTYTAFLDKYQITGSRAESTAIYTTNPNVNVGTGYITGYGIPVYPGTKGLEFSREAISSGDGAVVPQEILSFTWVERPSPAIDLGIGEGLKISWKAQLFNDTSAKEFGYVGFEKASSTDNRISNFVVGNSADGGTTAPSDYFVVEAAGPTRPGTDNNKSLGTASFRWSVVFAGNGTINTSDAREKQQIRELSDVERAVALRCKQLIRAFKFNDAVEEKGDGARTHFGVIAQEVKSAFEQEGLDPFAYGILCLDAWDQQSEAVTKKIITIDENEKETIEHQLTDEIKIVREAGERYGIRYEQLLIFIISAM